MFILYWEETAAARKTNVLWLYLWENVLNIIHYPVSEKSGVLEGDDVACPYWVCFVLGFF